MKVLQQTPKIKSCMDEGPPTWQILRSILHRLLLLIKLKIKSWKELDRSHSMDKWKSPEWPTSMNSHAWCTAFSMFWISSEINEVSKINSKTQSCYVSRDSTLAPRSPVPCHTAHFTLRSDVALWTQACSRWKPHTRASWRLWWGSSRRR